MKLSVKPQLLKILTLSAGALGLALRNVLYATGIDEKGLLITGHWASVSLWVLTLGVILCLFLLTRPLRGPETYRDCHPASGFRALGALLGSAGLLLTTLKDISAADGAQLLTVVLGFAAAAALAVIGICRLTGRQPLFLLHGVVCICFALRMVGQYQHWSSDPQMQNYVFYLSSYVALMLSCYHQAAFDAGMGSHRDLWATSLISVYLCCLSLTGTTDTLLLAASAIWAFTNLTSLSARPRRQRPALNLEEQPPQEEV